MVYGIQARWFSGLKWSRPIWKSREEVHELLTDGNPSDHTTATWPRLSRRDHYSSPFQSVAIKTFCCTALLVFVLSSGLFFSRKPARVIVEHPDRPWEEFKRLTGYDQGIGSLVTIEEFIPENANQTYRRQKQTRSHNSTLTHPTHFVSNVPRGFFTLSPYEPILRTSSIEYTHLPPIAPCFLDSANKIPAPSIYAFHGIPQHSVEPVLGSYNALGLREDVCFDRYGRYGPYGLGYTTEKGGSGLGIHGDQSLTEPIWATSPQIDWSLIDLADVQLRCYQRNQKRFRKAISSTRHTHVGSLAQYPDEEYQSSREDDGSLTTISRTVILLRTWGGLEYTPAVKMYIRSLINELSLYSGGEYDVQLLVEVKDSHRPIWTSERAYDEVLADIVPEEFRAMATLWSQKLMQLIYPGPFEPQFAFHGSMYPAMRSMHFALQWFMIQHPEYDYFWNWEMDIRYIGHFYELLDTTSQWARKQPRNHLWERSARFYIPSLYENWDDFVKETERKFPNSVDKEGARPDEVSRFDEEADLITFNPIFDPEHTLWNRRLDVTGYDTSKPIPQRRASIVVAARFSRRLLLIMHNETYIQRHSMASEMFPSSMCLHHGLKAVYAPHPKYLERDWPAKYAQEIFDGGGEGQSGGYEDSVFGEGPNGHEHALVGTTFYYNSHFAGLLWRRWMGYKEEGREERNRN